MPEAKINTSPTTDLIEFEKSLDELYRPYWKALLAAWSSGDFEREPLLRYRLLILCDATFNPQLVQTLPVPACESRNLSQTSDLEKLTLTYRLASYHVWLHWRQNNLIYLRRAMELYHEVIPCFPPEDPRKIYALIDVASLYRRDTSHAPSVRAARLELASTLLHQALDDCTHGKFVNLAGDARLWATERLTLTMIDRFTFSEPKNITLLEDGILYGRQLLELTHEHSIYYIRARLILAKALIARYEYTGDLQSCHLSVGCLEDALKVCPYPPLRMALISDLGLCLLVMVENTRDYSQLNRLVTICEEAVNICPKHHIRRAECVRDLADAYIKVYHGVGDMNMLNKGIALFEQSVQDSPPGHLQRHQCLFSASLGLAARVEKTGSWRDLERAMKYAKESLDIMKVGHPSRYMAQLSLAKLHLHDYCLHGGDSEDALELSISHLSLMVTDTAGDARDRLFMSVAHLRLIRGAMILPTTRLLQALLTAYQQTLALLPKVILVGMDVRSRLRDLEQTEQLAVASAEVALMIGKSAIAVECLEEGRSVFWAQGLALRSSYDNLPGEMATELETITSELEKCSYTGLDTTSEDTREIPEDVGVKMRRLGVRFDVLIERARNLPGLDGCLSRLTFTTLSRAIGTHPVVLLLASSVACQAILITGSENPLCVPLPGMTIETLVRAASLIKSENTSFRSRMVTGIAQECRARSFIRRNIHCEAEETMERVLSNVWRHVVQPVINALGLEVNIQSILK
jgi:hypothetical protein